MIVCWASLGMSQENTGPQQRFLAYLFYLKMQGVWEISEDLFSLLLYKGIGANSSELMQ